MPGIFTPQIYDLRVCWADRRSGQRRYSSARAWIFRVVQVVNDQDRTDLEKSLDTIHCAPISCAMVFWAGGWIIRWRAFNAISEVGQRLAFLVDAEDVCAICPPHLDLALARSSTRFSIFPAFDTCLGVDQKGLKWDLDGCAIDRPSGRWCLRPTKPPPSRVQCWIDQGRGRGDFPA